VPPVGPHGNHAEGVSKGRSRIRAA
jgi:hypothetical protein